VFMEKKMHRYAIGLLAALLFGAPIHAQETDTTEQEATESEASEPLESSETDADDEQDYYELEQDDFDPSQDVVADQSLAFPTDI